ncbi:MAG: glycoside hydrolase family 3 N-terminal domain-containing protein [Acidimicrobiales bacterium]
MTDGGTPEPYRPRHLATPAPGGRPPSAARPRARRWTAVAGALLAALVVTAAATQVLPDRSSDGGPEAASAVDGPADIDLCERAPLTERVGLVLVVGLPGVIDADHPLVDDLAEVGVGGVMLRRENIVDPVQAKELVAGLRARLGRHLLVAVDDEGGRVSSMGGLDQSLRSARRLGVAGPEAAEEFGFDLGTLAASIGIDWVLAPVADLDDGPFDDVIGDRSFSGDPMEASVAAAAFASGLQEAGLAVTAKHFPGHGGEGDPHFGDTIDDSTLADLEAADLVPFDRLIQQGADTVMVGHVIYPRIWGDLPASLAPGTYELLRQRGFEGVAVTDALGMGAIQNRSSFDEAPALAVAAGADAVLVNQGQVVLRLHAGLEAAVLEGRLDERRLDEAVGRVLALRGQDPAGLVCR